MTARLPAIVVTVCLCASLVSAQAPPALTSQQRDLLQALITAVDRAPAVTEPHDYDWLTHVLRVSDGSHYVAFSVTSPAAQPTSPLVVYIRLASAKTQGATTTAERSLVREWLLGSRVDPRLLPRKGGFAVGGMPAMGAVVERDGRSSVGSTDLQVMGLQRERSRERREQEERRRRATLEGTTTPQSDNLPFEDFDVVPPASFADGTRAIQRALTAGPGVYDLSVAWAEASQPAAKAHIHVARRSLQLAPAVATEFGLSSVIVADQIGVRATPYSSLEQRAHPYAIGVTEIMPARDAVFTPDEQLAVAFQIVNPAASASGKPDVRVNLRIVRATGGRDEVVASLSPLTYDAATLPADFDVRLGHPVIAALAAPLTTIPRGEYRLVITAEDRIASTVVAGGTMFTVVGTRESLLAEAPPFGARFQPAAVLQSPILNEMLDRLAPATPSPALAGALQSARTGRFAELLVADVVPPAERGVRTALGGLALLSLGNPSATAEFQRALVMQAPLAPVQFLLAAAQAMQGRDREAATAWEAARKSGFPAPAVDRLLAEAFLRQKDYARAAAAIGPRPPGEDAAGARTFAAIAIATRREAEAITALDALLARDGADLDARWLLVHALYSEFVHGNHGRQERLLAEAQRYVEAKGQHAALASEWLAVAAP
jgi:hypothetical protein